MNKIVSHLVAGALAALAFAPGAAGAMPFAIPQAPSSQILHVAGDCRAIGQQKAAENGGVLADARIEQRGSLSVCVGVIIVEGKNGERGKRIPFEVPL